MTSLKGKLSLLHWRHTEFNETVNEIYDMFLKSLTDIYDANSSYGSTFLKIKTSNPLGSAKV